MKKTFLSLIALAGILVFTACNKKKTVPEGQLPDRQGSTWSAISSSEIELDASMTYVDLINENLGSDQKAENVLSYQTLPTLDPSLAERLQTTNTDMENAGFDNFSASRVYAGSNESIVYYSVLRKNSNRDLCMAVFDTQAEAGDPPTVILEGPTAVGIGLTVRDASEVYTATQLEDMFLPTESIDQGTGSFSTGMTDEVFHTKSGTVQVEYSKTGVHKGFIRVFAEGCNEFPDRGCESYKLVKDWTVHF